MTIPPQPPAAIRRWIRTPCGRARYLELAARPGPWARLRLGWFVLIAALRDLPLPIPPEPAGPPG
ncbi:MAG: hypothetical protein VKM01_02330 [Cyanobacteriota bacterium]|nr:hypothetical protein [Cyanobacteriota bacterium]